MTSSPIKDALNTKINENRCIEDAAKRSERVGRRTASLFLMLIHPSMGFCARSVPLERTEHITGDAGRLLGEIPAPPLTLTVSQGLFRRRKDGFLISIRLCLVSGGCLADQYICAATFLRMRDQTKKPR